MARLDFGTASDRARRYLAGVFDDVEVRDGLVYRTTTNSRGQTVDLKLDVYEPAGDRASLRPAIVWMFGGYFASGDRAQLADMARGMARRGYVSVAIDYRTRPEIFDTSHGCVPVGGTCLDPTQLEPAIRDARDDARAAMVWLHEHAAELRIEPRAISAAGWSAGAITALNLAHDSTGDRDPASVPAAAVSLAGIVAAAPGAADPPTLMLGGNRDSLLSLDAQVAGCASIGTAGASCEFVAYAGVQPAPAEDPCVRYSVSCTYELGRDGDHGFFFSERPGVLDHISAFVAREVLRPVGLLDHRRRHHHEHGHHHHHDDGHHHRHHRHDEGHGHG
jgi:acetyl esterase/lipase